MQKVISLSSEHGKPHRAEIEGVGTVRQIEIADKLFALGEIKWAHRKDCFTSSFLTEMINKHNLFPRWF